MGHNDARSTKAERREAARAEAARLRAEQEAKAKRTRNITIAGILALVLIVAGVVYFVISNSKNKPNANGSGDGTVQLTGEETSEALSATDVGNSKTAGSISFGKDLQANTANEGKPVVEVYADYTCGHCFTFEQSRTPKLLEMAKAGEITLVFHPVAILDRTPDNSSYPSRAADAIFAIAKDDPSKVITANSKFFEVWHNFVAGGAKGTMPSSKEIAAAAAEVGVKQEIVDKIADGSVDRVAKNATDNAGISGTPTVLLNGETLDPKNWGTDNDGTQMRQYILDNS
ncbi:hypothetical protein BSZ39_07430 [Bowdeniella nasicola]|uniref:Thioredoxin-like fold domain-containing protein n=1 Tax=Bowdeniella nasicola TaxID=208480 RepID=A0A1Q5Q1T2_9ACTO|nr:DsbA family protein [Bowdeniella nasicola]OKL53833.1 hypothetical protein BSZ39_07430 [Bowdeniella nasicola]